MARVPHLRVTASGSMTGAVDTPEVWSFGFALAAPPPDSVLTEGTQAEADAIEALVRSMFTRAGTGISNQAALRSIKVALVGPNGHVSVREDGSYAQHAYVYGPTTVRGGGGALTHPYQVAHAVTLASSAGSGAKLGRFYLPAPTWAVAPDGLISQADASTVMNSVQTCLQGLNALPTSAVVSIASGGSVPKGLQARNYPVTTLRVGRVLDTMRSRRNQLTEAYVSNGV